MQIREPYRTEAGTIRCASAGEDSWHEFRFNDGNVMYSRIRTDGTPYGEYAEWRTLSPVRIADQYRVGHQELIRWFHEHGFTRERIEQIEAQERENEKARRREKRRPR